MDDWGKNGEGDPYLSVEKDIACSGGTGWWFLSLGGFNKIIRIGCSRFTMWICVNIRKIYDMLDVLILLLVVLIEVVLVTRDRNTGISVEDDTPETSSCLILMLGNLVETLHIIS